MRSLADNYRETHASNHETIADLVFCALVVLLLFVLALSFEVSQRVRSRLDASKPVDVRTVRELNTLSIEEIEKLSINLQEQQAEIADLKSQLKLQESQVKRQMDAIAGEQRFTGAREPAALCMAYDYKSERFYFAPSKDVEHADRRQSGESMIEYGTRKTRELASLALKLREQRGFTESEVKSLYSAATRYNEVTETNSGYALQPTEVGLYYHTLLSEYVAGDVDSLDYHDLLVTEAIQKMGENPGMISDQMYPSWHCIVDARRMTIGIGSVTLEPDDLLKILLSVRGRGVVLDFEGYQGPPPKWLYEKVLMPAGYISKTPKLPQM